jgi:hypothetical protein
MRMTVVMLAVWNLRRASPRNVFTAATSRRLLTWSDRVTVKRSELAARAVEEATDKSQPAEEQQRRKRKLIKGPSEFRDIRRDQPKRKQ